MRPEGTYDIPEANGLTLKGKNLSIVIMNGGNAGPRLYGHLKVTITTKYEFTKCGAPTNVSGTLPYNGWITLTWGAGSDGVENAVSAYDIQYQDSSDGQTWGNWTTANPGQVAAGTLTTQEWNNPTNGQYRRFRVRTVGAQGADWASDWVVSNIVKTNSTAPTFTSSVTSVTNTGVLHNVTPGLHIRGLTKIKAEITNAQGATPKTIAWYAIDMQQYGHGDGAALTSLTSNDVVNSVGNVTIGYSVADSQGYTSSQTKTINVIDYYSPGIQIQFVRCRDMNKNQDPLGQYIMYRATTTFTAVDGNAIASVVAKINNVNYNIIADGGWYMLSGYIQGPTERRDVVITVEDKFTRSTIGTAILSANYAIYLNENGTAIGFGTSTSRANAVEIALNRTLYVPNITIVPTVPGQREYT